MASASTTSAPHIPVSSPHQAMSPSTPDRATESLHRSSYSSSSISRMATPRTTGPTGKDSLGVVVSDSGTCKSVPTSPSRPSTATRPFSRCEKMLRATLGEVIIPFLPPSASASILFGFQEQSAT